MTQQRVRNWCTFGRHSQNRKADEKKSDKSSDEVVEEQHFSAEGLAERAADAGNPLSQCRTLAEETHTLLSRMCWEIIRVGDQL